MFSKIPSASSDEANPGPPEPTTKYFMLSPPQYFNDHTYSIIRLFIDRMTIAIHSLLLKSSYETFESEGACIILWARKTCREAGWF
jgi:hypothetical protein